MKIQRLTVYQVNLPLHEGSYKWSGGKSVTVFDSTVVKIDTDDGITGFGEVCPLGPFYLPAYAAGCRTGIKELGPHLLGEDPRQLEKLNRRMDACLKGHPYVKSAIDMACWDILGKATGLPVCILLGGRYGKDFGLYRAISQESPEAIASEFRIQLPELQASGPLSILDVSCENDGYSLVRIGERTALLIYQGHAFLAEKAPGR